nr:hypothetical protein GCM10020185_75340 [Pseudomonas brassicacearum subsp. brassicacearum]
MDRDPYAIVLGLRQPEIHPGKQAIREQIDADDQARHLIETERQRTGKKTTIKALFQRQRQTACGGK